MFSPDMLAAAQKMMQNMSPEQMSQIAGMASKMNPDLLKNMSGGNAGMPMPSASQFQEAQEKMKNMSSEDMKNMFNAAAGKMAGQNSYMVNGATVLKNEGNDKVRAGDYAGGIEIFTKALSNLASCPPADPGVASLAQSIKLNMALCYLKLEKFNDCVSTCDEIIVEDKTSVKALYRRGVANRERGEVVAGAVDLKLSMLLAEQKDQIINSEYEKTLHMISDASELETVDAVSLATYRDPSTPTSRVTSGDDLSKAKEIIESNPDVIDKMGDVISQLDDTQLDGILSMSAAGNGGLPEGVDLGEMKKILKNKDFMKSMSDMMKNMDPSVMETLSRSGMPTAGSSTSSSSAPSLPKMDGLLSDPNALKSVEAMVESMPDKMLEEMLTSGVASANGGTKASLPSFLTGARMKWLVKRVLSLVRFWIWLKRLFAILLSRNGKIVLAILVILFGIYQQYGHVLFGRKQDDETKSKDPSISEL